MSATAAVKLACPWCDYALIVVGDVPRDADHDADCMAAVQMRGHVAASHGKSWDEFWHPRENGATT